MRNLITAIFFLAAVLPLSAQDKPSAAKNAYTPYVGVLTGGCVDFPISFLAGVEKRVAKRITLAYDVHYWNTGYECYCGDSYSVGKYMSATPSVKLSFNTGKQQGRGLIAGVGLGYMFARDRGTEQTYLYDADKGYSVKGNAIKDGNWDFTSISPSVTVGAGFRVLRLPVTINTVYYFANTTDGWMAAAGGVGLKLGLKKVKQ